MLPARQASKDLPHFGPFINKQRNMSSRMLVIGGTGTMGQHLAKASLAAGHPTALLVRPATAADPGKLKLLEALKESGATIVKGDMKDQESLVAAIKESDVVISVVGHHHGPEELRQGQLNIVAAITQAGNTLQRFVASEYGMDVEQGLETAMEPARSILLDKVRVRQAVRAAGIPHTFVCSYWAHGFLLPRLGNPEAPPVVATGKQLVVTIFGDDNTRAIFVDEADMSRVVIRAVSDPRTLDKILYVRPASNVCSLSHIVRLWEEITGRVLDKRYVTQEELLSKIRQSPMPLSLQLAMLHATTAATGQQTVDAAAGVEATDLYPDINFVTVQEYLSKLSRSDCASVRY